MHWPYRDLEATADQLRGFLRIGSDPLAEGTRVEFKEKLGSDGVEIARDVSAMANGGGGLIFYGVREGPTGEAESAPGLRNVDGDLRRVHDLVRERCDLPPRFFPYRAGSDDAERHVAVIEVLPEEEHLCLVREQIASPAKFSCYVRRGPSKGPALTSSQIRSLWLDRIGSRAVSRERQIALEDYVLGQSMAPNLVALCISFSPSPSRVVLDRIGADAMKQAIADRRDSLPNCDPNRATLGHRSLQVRRVLEGLIASTKNEDIQARAGLTVTDSGIVAAAVQVWMMTTDFTRFLSNPAIRFEGKRAVLYGDIVEEAVQEMISVVAVLQDALGISCAGTWRFRIQAPQEVFLYGSFGTPSGRSTLRMSPAPLTSLYSGTDLSSSVVGEAREPDECIGVGDVSAALLDQFAAGFGWSQFPRS